MITKQRTLFYFVGDQAYKSLEDAQRADLRKLMPQTAAFSDAQETDGTPAWHNQLADWLMKNSAAIVDTLTTTPKSRLKGRKSHGAVRKPRAAKALPTVP